MGNNLYFILSYIEWLNFISLGYIIRPENFYIQLTAITTTKFLRLLYLAPFTKFNDDGAFIIVRLRSDWKNYVRDDRFIASFTWLGIEGVESFIPVSDRGRRLLESDAKNANVILEEPIFENHWKQWVENQRGIRSDQTGTLFAKTLFGDSLKVNQRMLKDGRDCLKKSGSLAGDKKFDALEFTCAYAWAKSFALFSLFVSEKDRKEAIEGLQINKIINDLSGNHNVLSPILIDSEYIEVEKSLTAILKRQKEPIRFPFAFFLVVFHYAHLLDANETYSLDSFRNDLTYFDSKSGPQMRYALAYLVGSRMPDKSVTGLWYEKYKEGLPFVRK